MRDEYDFSKGERGKFFRPDAKLNLPIYLDDEVMSFVKMIAQKKRTDINSVVNKILRSDMLLLEELGDNYGDASLDNYG